MMAHPVLLALTDALSSAVWAVGQPPSVGQPLTPRWPGATLQVMFFVDDLGYGDLGFTGHPTTHTPALDRLASTGKRLTQWYSGYPVCTSSRTALMTGRQPGRVGMPGVINSLSAAGLPLTETTLADDLSAGGCESDRQQLLLH